MNDCPFARRLAIEKGSAAPTRNENDGWIRSCSEQPVHSTCDVLNASCFQTGLSGNDLATCETCRTSAIIRNITNPRKASSDERRLTSAGEGGGGGGVTGGGKGMGASHGSVYR